MKYRSTRNSSGAVSFSQALFQGLAPDGGLYIPEALPLLRDPAPAAASLREVAERLLSPLLISPEDNDPLIDELSALCAHTFSFPIPLRSLDQNTWILELFHGPTAAFKDVGARFLAGCLRVLRAKSPRRATVLVATSGDTGGAVAAAFHQIPGIDVVILFPKGRVSARQEHQLCAWGGNVRAMAVRGSFDDCQRIVKEAFGNPDLRRDRDLLSANSINIGRLLPQAVYYAWASLEARKNCGQPVGFIVPTGNLGNGVAALLAQRMGYPIREIVFATNANRPIPDFLATGTWQPQPTIATSANAMDVGNPSNLERLRSLIPDFAELARTVRAFSVDDATIAGTIQRWHAQYGEIVCPHTATGAHIRDQLRVENHLPWAVVATAHPAKFETIVEPLLRTKIPVPPALAQLLAKPASKTEIDPTLEALLRVLPSL